MLTNIIAIIEKIVEISIVSVIILLVVYIALTIIQEFVGV